MNDFDIKLAIETLNKIDTCGQFHIVHPNIPADVISELRKSGEVYFSMKVPYLND